MDSSLDTRLVYRYLKGLSGKIRKRKQISYGNFR